MLFHILLSPLSYENTKLEDSSFDIIYTHILSLSAFLTHILCIDVVNNGCLYQGKITWKISSQRQTNIRTYIHRECHESSMFFFFFYKCWGWISEWVYVFGFSMVYTYSVLSFKITANLKHYWFTWFCSTIKDKRYLTRETIITPYYLMMLQIFPFRSFLDRHLFLYDFLVFSISSPLFRSHSPSPPHRLWLLHFILRYAFFLSLHCFAFYVLRQFIIIICTLCIVCTCF